MKRVIGFVALALMFAQIGCATSSYKHFDHSESEVVTAMLEAEEATLARLQDSASCDVAEAARQVAKRDRVH
jgi:hypothetical protein